MPYASESLLFMEGWGDNRQEALPIPANEHLPVFLSEKPKSLFSAFSFQGTLWQMVDKMRGQKVPPHIAQVIREAALSAVSENDCWWAPSMLRKFYDASRPLGAGMEDAAFAQDMVEALMTRLHKDILDQPMDHHTTQRILHVRNSFNTIGAKFTDDHLGRITEFLYDRCVTILQTTQADLIATMEETEAMIDHIHADRRFGIR